MSEVKFEGWWTIYRFFELNETKKNKRKLINVINRHIKSRTKGQKLAKNIEN